MCIYIYIIIIIYSQIYNKYMLTLVVESVSGGAVTLRLLM